MNTNQWLAFRKLREQVNDGSAPPHIVTEGTSPVSVRMRCSCGWICQVTRRQNALARNAKLEAAVRAHFAEVIARRATHKVLP